MDLRERRQLAGLTQGQLARRVGCSQGHISMVECGMSESSGAELEKIEAALSKRYVAAPSKVLKDQKRKEALHRIWVERYGN